MNLTNFDTLRRTQSVMCNVLIVLTILFSASSSILAASDPGHSYPKLASVQIAGQSSYAEESRQRDIAKMDVVIMGFWPGWAVGNLKTRDVVTKIKALNPKIIIANYTNINEAKTGARSGAYDELKKKISAEVGPNGSGDWWARDAAGSLTQSWPGSNTMNMTEFVTPDSDGKKLPQWYAEYVFRTMLDPVPEFNAIYIDVFRNKPLVNADWNGDGKNDSKEDSLTQAWYTAGQRHYVNALKSKYPQHAVIVNATSWQRDSIPENYKDILDGGILEAAMGASWSIEGSDADGSVNNRGSWQKMMDAYHNLVRDTVTPHYAILNMRGKIDDFAFMRYGLASTLMDDGYFAFDDDAKVFQSVPIFDEYNVELGQPVDGPQFRSWSKGIYRRDFTNGTVLVNPRGNGTQTVLLEDGFRRIQGNQDPTHNNGQRVSLITLNDKDGIILVRIDGPVVRPQPPILE